MKTKDIIAILDNAKRSKNETQEQLRKYVLDKNIPMEERFRVWIAYCDKENKTIDIPSFGIFKTPQIIRVCPNMNPCDKIKEILIQENCNRMSVI